MNQPAPFGNYQPSPPQYQGWTSQGQYLTLRDGVRLAVQVILPRNLPSGTRLPALLSQTRYWRAMALRPPLSWFLRGEDLNPDWRPFNPFFTGHGYALVKVDVRGTGASFGTWPYPWPEDSVQDQAEIVDWIVAQPWSNGRVGGYGISYLGTTAELLAVPNHPAVQALIPQFNHPDPYTDITLPGGLLNERFMSDWGYYDHMLDRNQVPRELGILAPLIVAGVKPVDGPDGRRLLAEAVAAHEANGDVHRLIHGITFRDQPHPDLGVSVDDMAVHRHRAAIDRAAVPHLGWASWMDAGTADAVIRRFLSFDYAGHGVIGAWEHGGRFHASPFQRPGTPVSPSLPAQWGEMLRFFDATLKDADNGVRDGRALYYYTLGAERWNVTDTWPPAGTQVERWYLAENRALAPEAPEAASGADTYTVDFEATTGDLNRWWEMSGIVNKSVTYPDRAAADRRLLTYTSPPLREDVEITGYPIIAIHLAGTHNDGALFVYLEDVAPDGRVTYLTEGQLRLIHRHVSDERPPYVLQVPYHTFREADARPMVPGETAEITFGLNPISALVRAGHSIRIALAGHDQGTFPRIPAEGTPTWTVARDAAHPSYIDLPARRP
jgi:putative CocE/NonD family hydrolase